MPRRAAHPLFASRLALLLALLLAPGLLTQAPQSGRSAWAELPLAAAVATSQVSGLGKLTVYRDGELVHVHSAATRRWHTQWIGNNATLRVTNDWLLAQSNGIWWAMAACDGQFAPLVVGPGAVVVNPVGQQNDSLLLVHDGNRLAAFSGLIGGWASRSISAGFGCSIQRHVAIVEQAGQLAAIDSFRCSWQPLGMSFPAAWLSADGTTAIASDQQQLAGYSAKTGSWQLAPSPSAGQLVRSSDWAIVHNSSIAVAFSGLLGSFAIATHQAWQVAQREEAYCLLSTTAGHVAYSASRGNFSAVLAPHTARWVAGSSAVVFADGPLLTGYSPLLDSSSLLVLDSVAEDAAGLVAYALPRSGEAPWCYSALRGHWSQAPPGTPAQLALMTANSLLWQLPNGLLAFSGRRNSFVPLLAPQLLPIGNRASAVVGAWNDQDLFAFDARADQWQRLPRSDQAPPIIEAWRTALLVVEGNRLAGFGAQGSGWATTTLSEPMLNARASSESSRVLTASRIWAHAALAEVVSTVQFPEFRRIAVAGNNISCQLAVDPGSLACFAMGLPAANFQPLPGLGDLWIEPTTLASRLLVAGSNVHRLSLDLPTPAAGWLVGSDWRCQALVLTPQASWITEPASLLLL